MPKSPVTKIRPGPRPKPSYYDNPHKFPSPTINYRQAPHFYRIHRAETGVLTCEPYKSEICPHWRFRTPEIARRSAADIEGIFVGYLDTMENERGVEWQRAFVGADMCRKFIQMGMTRAKRYANHASGRKYAEDGTVIPIIELDQEKLEASEVFKECWNRVRLDERYVKAKDEWGRLVKGWEREAKKGVKREVVEDEVKDEGVEDPPRSKSRPKRVKVKKEIKEEEDSDA
ncbi:hypothetical protein YB2330_002590 [Saitoella coloradoensis]